MLPLSALAQSAASAAGAGAGAGALVHTLSLHRALALLAPWVERGEHILLRGPPGCGKRTALAAALAAASSPAARRTALVVLHCTARTGPEALLAALARACTLASTGSGRVLRPREAERVLLLPDGVEDIWNRDYLELITLA